MPLISKEEAQQYIPLKEDVTGRKVADCPYFTFTKDEEGWDIVTYYTAIKRNSTVNIQGNYNSIVYILSSPSQPNLVKIGFTDRNAEDRAKEISRATGVALPFKVQWVFHCYNGKELEGRVHRHLKEYRVNKDREFFNISVKEAIKVIIDLGQKFI